MEAGRNSVSDIDEWFGYNEVENIVSGELNEEKVCRLRKSIYGLKTGFETWYIKFDYVITSFGFAENRLHECIYTKVCGCKFIFLVLCVDI